MELLLPGTVIFGRFQIDKMIGGGGQSFGFRGTDLNAPPAAPWERPVFVKQYHDVLPRTEEAAALGPHFRALQDRLKEKSHYLCLPRYIGETANSVTAVFDWVPGKSLRDWMSEGLSQKQCVRFAQAITNAIRILHSQGVAHLDLKPSNVLIEENSKSGKLFVRLIDTDASRIDGVGMRKKIYGTAGYMSPEHFAPSRFGMVSERSDVFTLGIMLFELLLKQHPFPGSDFETAVVNGSFCVPRNLYHRDVVVKVVGCLSADPERRPTAGWVHSALHTHNASGFEATAVSDRWVAGSILLNSGSFRRVYYRTVHLGRTNFRGAGIADLPHRFLKLVLQHDGAFAELLDARVAVRVSSVPLIIGRVHPIRSGDTLWIANTGFAVEVRDE